MHVVVDIYMLLFVLVLIFCSCCFVLTLHRPPSIGEKNAGSWHANLAVSQRLSRLYQSRSLSLNNLHNSGPSWHGPSPPSGKEHHHHTQQQLPRAPPVGAAALQYMPGPEKQYCSANSDYYGTSSGKWQPLLQLGALQTWSTTSQRDQLLAD